MRARAEAECQEAPELQRLQQLERREFHGWVRPGNRRGRRRRWCFARSADGRRRCRLLCASCSLREIDIATRGPRRSQPNKPPARQAPPLTQSGFLYTHTGTTPLPSQNSFQSMFRLPSLRHRDSLPPHAPVRSLQTLEKSQQGFRVFVSGPRRRKVRLRRWLARPADRELPIQPPGKRTEPEDCTMEPRETLRQSVAPDDVRQLVRNHCVELRIVPLAPARQAEGSQARTRQS